MHHTDSNDSNHAQAHTATHSDMWTCFLRYCDSQLNWLCLFYVSIHMCAIWLSNGSTACSICIAYHMVHDGCVEYLLCLYMTALTFLIPILATCSEFRFQLFTLRPLQLNAESQFSLFYFFIIFASPADSRKSISVSIFQFLQVRLNAFDGIELCDVEKTWICILINWMHPEMNLLHIVRWASSTRG